MRSIPLVIVLMLSAGTANADMFDGLRELRGTLGEAIQTKREIGRAGDELTPASAPQSQAQQQAQKASAPINSGDILVAKLANVKMYKEPNKNSVGLLQISKSEAVVYLGEEQNGLYKVAAAGGEGWVDKLLVKKQ